MINWSFQPIMDSYGIVAVVAVILVLSLWARPFRTLDHRRRRTLLILRGLVILIIVVAMLRPTRTSTESQPQTAVLLILFDQSRSMQLPHSSGDKSRWEAECDTLQQIKPVLKKISKKLEVKVQPYATTLEPSIWKDGKLELPKKANGKSTDIGTSLHEAVQQELGKRLAAVILMGDGTQTASHPSVEIYAAARELGNLGYPLYTVPYGPSGNVSQSRDVAVENLPDHYTVFVKNKLLVRGMVRVRGYVNKQIPVQLRIIDSAGHEQSVGPVAIRAGHDNQAVNVELEYVPEKAGQYKLILEAAPQPGELVTNNNQLTAFVTVLEGGLKVLYLEGALRQEQKFIRWALDQSTDIDLDFHWYSPRLRDRWPVDLTELIAKGNYDVFLIGDCDSRIFGKDQLKKLAAQVEKGKGLMTLGGFHAYGPGGYTETALADVLPVEMNRFACQQFGRPVEQRWHVPGPLQMVPTRPSPVTLLAAPDRNMQAWRELKPLRGANRWNGLKDAPGVQLLAQSDGPKKVPLLVAGAYGEGRVLAFAGDSTWQWWRQGLQKRHKRFWRQAVLWLARRDDLTRHDVWIEMDQRRFTVGSQVDFTCGVRTAAGDMIRNAAVSATFTDADGKSHLLKLTRDGDHYRGTIVRVSRPGSASIRVTATDSDGKQLGSRTAHFEIMDRDVELSNPAADHDQLARLARFTRDAGGRLVAPEQLAKLLQEIDRKPPKLAEDVVTRWQLGDTWIGAWLVLLCLVALLGAEWYLRKRWSLV